jgi:hypothetical protein
LDDVLGLVGIAAFIAGILALSAAVTYLVVRIDSLIRDRRRPSS